jgi:hypothetical protein
MVRVGRARQRFRCPPPEPWLDAEPFRSNLAEIQPMGAFTSNGNEIHTRRQEVLAGAKALAAEPLNAITAHRAPQFSGYDDPQPRRPGRRRLRSDQQREVRGRDAGSQPLRAHELRVPPQPPVPPELERHYFL